MDGLIGGCFTANGKYSIHVSSTISTNCYALTNAEWGNRDRERLLTSTGQLSTDEHLVICSGSYATIYKRSRYHVGSVELAKHVTHYCSKSCFRIITPLLFRGHPYLPHDDPIGSYMGRALETVINAQHWKQKL